MAKGIRVAWSLSIVGLTLVVPTWLMGYPWLLQSPGANSWLVFGIVAVYVAASLAGRCAKTSDNPLPTFFAELAVAGVGLAAVAYLLIVLEPDYSRLVLFESSVLIGTGVVVPHLFGLPRRQLAQIVGIAAVVAIPAAAGAYVFLVHGEHTTRTAILAASQQTLSADYYGGYVPREPGIEVQGGAIAVDPAGRGYVLATPRGALYRAEWNEGDELSVTDLGMKIPVNNADFEADGNGFARTHKFRVTDLMVRNVHGQSEVTAAHLYWRRDDQCIVLRISHATLPAGRAPASRSQAGWSTLYETSPCLDLGAKGEQTRFGLGEAGGKLFELPSGKLLLTVGDFQFDGWYQSPNLVQDPRADYGKTLLIDPESGTSSVFSIGHRNSEGLVVTSGGLVWETENGPQGGDELNLIRAHGNYGWPYRTYGTDYGSVLWPLSGQGQGEAYIEPAYAWVPSIGISDLIEVQDRAFKRWRGDLLAGSLIGQSLWRIRVRDDDRVAYAERVEIGERVRDIAVGDGELVLWTDSYTLVRIKPLESLDDGTALFTVMCNGCHDDSDNGIGPALSGVMARSIASAPGYAYSSALQQLGGRWSADKLDTFLSNPQSFAQGTSMGIEPISDQKTRAKIIEYLSTLD